MNHSAGQRSENTRFRCSQIASDDVCTCSHTWWALCTSKTGQLWSRSVLVHLRGEGLVCSAQLRGNQPNAKELRQQEDGASLSGLRNTAEVVAKLPGHLRLGAVLAQFFLGCFRNDHRFWSGLLDVASGGKRKQRHTRKKLAKPCQNRGSSWRVCWLSLVHH